MALPLPMAKLVGARFKAAGFPYVNLALYRRADGSLSGIEYDEHRTREDAARAAYRETDYLATLHIDEQGQPHLSFLADYGLELLWDEENERRAENYSVWCEARDWREAQL